MLSRSTRSFFKKQVVHGVNSSKTAIQNFCLMRLYDADAELKAISNELDSFDGKKDPIRCNLLVNQLRTAQDKVISLLFQFMDDCNCERASRDYRMKFPDEILLSEGSESLNGQIWFGAECLSAGSNILNHTKESTMLRPMAKTLTQHLDSLRNDLRELALDITGVLGINQTLIRKMVEFDRTFATFEYEYVRTMLPIRTVAEIEKLQEVAVLFSETLIDCVKRGLIKQDDIDEFQPIVMIAIPRLAIVRGLLYKNENPIFTKHKSHMCSLFQPFHGPLHSIRRLLRGLSLQELFTLERMLANDQSNNDSKQQDSDRVSNELADDKPVEENDSMQCKAEDQANRSCESEHTSHASTSNNNYANVLMDGLQYPVGHKRSDEDAIEQNCSNVIANQDTVKQQGQGYNCYLEVQASSSKASHDVNQHQLADNARQTPTTSTPSPSSSVSSTTAIKCNKYGNTNDSETRDSSAQQKNECDNENCCLSLPESDAQLDKLIANFSPSIGDDQTQDQSENSAQNVISNSTNLRNHSSGSSSQINIAPLDGDQEQHLSTPEACEYNGSTQAASTGHRDRRVRPSQLCSPSTPARDSKDEALEKLFQKQAEQLLHRLFVAISGVADQLQSNFASDLRFILRHIFSSQIANDEDNMEDDSDEQYDEVYNDEEDEVGDEEGDDSNNNLSDNSLPIEQGIEAQEVANLIDLESGYSPNEPSFAHATVINEALNFAPNTSRSIEPTSSSEFPYMAQVTHDSPIVTDLNCYHSTTDNSSVYVPNQLAVEQHDDCDDDHQNLQYHRQHQTVNDNIPQQLNHSTLDHIHQDASGNEVTNDNHLVAQEQMRGSDRAMEFIYDTRSSPNDPSIMDTENRQQLLQRHLQSANRLVDRVNQRSLVSGQLQQQQGHTERRSRHHHGSRSRRSRGPPVWVPDQLVIQCNCCQAPFTLFRRRHHCRACGQIFCSDCSRFTKNLNCWGYNGPVRVCEACHNQP